MKNKNLDPIGVAVRDVDTQLPQIYLSEEAVRSKNTEYYFVRELAHILRFEFGRNVNVDVSYEEGFADFVAQSVTSLTPFGAISAFFAQSKDVRTASASRSLSLADYGQAYLYFKYLYLRSNGNDWLRQAFRGSPQDVGWMDDMDEFTQNMIFTYYGNPIYSQALFARPFDSGEASVQLGGIWAHAVYDITYANRRGHHLSIASSNKALRVRMLVFHGNLVNWLDTKDFPGFVSTHAVKRVLLVLINTSSESDSIRLRLR